MRVFLLRVSKTSTLTNNRANSVITKNSVILNIIHNKFNIRNTEVVICIMFVLVKRVDDLDHYLTLYIR